MLKVVIGNASDVHRINRKPADQSTFQVGHCIDLGDAERMTHSAARSEV